MPQQQPHAAASYWIWAAEQRCCGIAFHSSTTIWRRSCMVALVRTALPSWSHNGQWCSGLDCIAGQAKRSPGLLQTQTLPSTFSYTLPVFSQWHGLYPPVTNVACHCMDHGNNDHCLTDDAESVTKVIERWHHYGQRFDLLWIRSTYRKHPGRQWRLEYSTVYTRTLVRETFDLRLSLWWGG